MDCENETTLFDEIPLFDEEGLKAPRERIAPFIINDMPERDFHCIDCGYDFTASIDLEDEERCIHLKDPETMWYIADCPKCGKYVVGENKITKTKGGKLT